MGIARAPLPRTARLPRTASQSRRPRRRPADADTRRRTGQAFLGWAAVYAVSQANIARTLGPAAPKLLKIQTATSAARYHAVLDSMTPREASGYRAHYPLDMVHPLIYAMALRAGARALDARTPQPEWLRRLLLAAPFVSAGCDYVENVAGWYLIDHREHVSDAGTRAVTAVSTLKWALALGELGHVASGLTAAALRR